MGQEFYCGDVTCNDFKAQTDAACHATGTPAGGHMWIMLPDRYCYCICSCVAGDTLVAVSAKDWKQMEQIRVGENVLTLKEDKTWTSTEVKYSGGVPPRDEMLAFNVIFVETMNDLQFIVTPDHIFLMPDKRLKRASRLTVSDELVDEKLKPIKIRNVGYGKYKGSIHNIATSLYGPGESMWDGHLINTGGVISGDFYAQMNLIKEQYVQIELLPEIGSVEYEKKYNYKPLEVTVKSLQSESGVDTSRFKPAKKFTRPEGAVSILPDEMSMPVPGSIRSPLVALSELQTAVEVQLLFQYVYPDITFHIEWEDNTVNAYAWVENNRKHVAMLGGLIRHIAIFRQGISLVFAHEVGHHYGGEPRYPNSWASCEGQADYWGAYVGHRQTYLDERSVDYTMKGADQLYNLFSFQFNALDDSTKEKLQKEMAVAAICSHPPAQCRKDTYVAGARLEAKPSCAG